jgi:hypothetical protein
MTLSIMTNQHNYKKYNNLNERRSALSVLSVVMLSIAIDPIMPSVIMASVVALNVVAPIEKETIGRILK